MLQETIAHHRERQNNVYVVMLDVAKAFDSVWTEGLFYKLFHIGLEGRLWRLLRNRYEGFACKVLVNGTMSVPWGSWQDLASRTLEKVLPST